MLVGEDAGVIVGPLLESVLLYVLGVVQYGPSRRTVWLVTHIDSISVIIIEGWVAVREESEKELTEVWNNATDEISCRVCQPVGTE